MSRTYVFSYISTLFTYLYLYVCFIISNSNKKFHLIFYKQNNFIYLYKKIYLKSALLFLDKRITALNFSKKRILQSHCSCVIISITNC